jgi:predicted lactoylglutathione lyase
MADRKLFVSFPIRDLERSKAFFSTLGFTFDPQFSGDGGACLVINAEARVMLVTETIFKTLTERDVCDTRTHVEVLVTVSCESRAEVDQLVNLAASHGGKAAGAAQDHGFMYDWGFYDPDGHGWGVTWMNPAAGPT